MAVNSLVLLSSMMLGITPIAASHASAQSMSNSVTSFVADRSELAVVQSDPSYATSPTARTLAQADIDIVDTALQQSNLMTFMDLFQELGMQEDLRGYGRFTVFAPTDDAFEALDSDVMAVLLGDRELLAKVLSYHVIASGTPIYADDITTTTSYRTLERSDLEIRPRGSRIYVDGVRVVDEDIEATNGVIHVIDEVLIPLDVLEQLP